MTILGPDNVRSLVEYRQRQAERRISPAHPSVAGTHLPVVLGAIPVERQRHIEHEALIRAAHAAKAQAQRGASGGFTGMDRRSLDWHTLLAISTWLEQYAESLSTSS